MIGRARRLSAAAVVIGVAALPACGGDDAGGGGTTTPAVTRAEVAAAITDLVVIPAYEALADAAGTLVDQIAALCAEPTDATLAASRQAWRDVDSAWATTRAFRYGPTKQMRAVSRVDYPVDAVKVADLLAGTDPVDATALAAVGADRRGLGAIELVLFADAAPGDRACQFADAAATLVAEATTTLAGDWEASSADTEMTIEDGINGIIFALSDIGDMQLANAAGVVSGVPAPEEVDGGPARAARAALIAVHGGIDSVWSGGYRDLVAAVSSDTASRFDEQLAGVGAALAALPDPLAGADDAGSATAAYEAVRAALVTVRTEIASQLGVTLQLSDADGDS